MSKIFQIKNTEGDKTISIQPGGINGINSVFADSDVNLIGQGAIIWGESFNESLYRSVENFACPEKVASPGEPQDETDLGSGLGINNPITGQIWFNKTTNKMMVFSTAASFESVNSVLSGTVEPTVVVTGDLWFDENIPQLKIYDGASFLSVADRYLPLDGTSAMTGELDAGGNAIINVADTPSTGFHATNKNYVDDEITTLTSSLTGGLLDTLYVNLTGDTISGQLKGITPIADEDLTRKDYVDAQDAVVVASSVQKPGSSVVGNFMAFDASKNAVDSGVAPADVSSLPGSVVMYAGSVAPSGFLLCDGSQVNRTTFADLFAIIGTAYGIGDGSTTFNLPNFDGRMPMGVGSSTGANSNVDSVALAEEKGSWDTELVIANMPAHDHGGGSHTHFTFKDEYLSGGSRDLDDFGSFAPAYRRGSIGNDSYEIAASNSTIPDLGVTSSAVGSVNSEGSGTGASTIPPLVGINFIIKT